jgi:hypothetical protein
MSTSSAYSSNKLKQVLENKTQHFILKSFVYPAFEHHRRKSEYHLYWINLNKGAFEEYPRYKNMSCKLMNRKELKLFLSMLSEYNVEVDSRNGTVWENKKLGLDKDLVLNKDFIESIS